MNRLTPIFIVQAEIENVLLFFWCITQHGSISIDQDTIIGDLNLEVTNNCFTAIEVGDIITNLKR